MKTILLILACSVSAVFGAIHADGHGFYPVIVQVVEEESGTPVKDVRVRMVDLPPYSETVTDPARRTKVLPEQLGKVVTTDISGVAVVFYFGHWGSFTSDTENTYSRSLVGTVVVEHKGKEIFRKSLEDWAKANDFKPDACAAPLIVVAIPKRETTAEQGGAGQPANRPEPKSEGSDKPQPEAEGRSQ